MRWNVPIVVIMALSTTAPARAQATQEPDETARPFRGVFGAPQAPASERLIFGLTLGAGYDDNVFADDSSLSSGFDPLRPRRSTTGFLTANLSYSRGLAGGNLTAAINSATRYYDALRDPLVSRQMASVAGSWKLTSRTSATASQNVRFEPYYSLWAAESPTQPDAGPGAFDADPGTQTRVANRLRLGTNVALSQQLSRRSSVSIDYGRQHSQTGQADFGLELQHTGVSVRHAVGRGVAVRLGYRYLMGRFDADDESDRFANHSADFGLDFGRGFSLRRGTTLGVGTGVVAIRQADSTRYRLTGHVRLAQELGRTWSASIAYARYVRYVDSFRQPVLADSLGATVGGLVNRRLGLAGGVGVSEGDIGTRLSSNRFRLYYGNAGVTVGIRRNVGLGVSYSYNRYRFGSDIDLPRGVPRRVGRQAVTVSLQLTPLISWTGR